MSRKRSSYLVEGGDEDIDVAVHEESQPNLPELPGTENILGSQTFLNTYTLGERRKSEYSHPTRPRS